MPQSIILISHQFPRMSLRTRIELPGEQIPFSQADPVKSGGRFPTLAPNTRNEPSCRPSLNVINRFLGALIETVHFSGPEPVCVCGSLRPIARALGRGWSGRWWWKQRTHRPIKHDHYQRHFATGSRRVFGKNEPFCGTHSRNGHPRSSPRGQWRTSSFFLLFAPMHPSMRPQTRNYAEEIQKSNSAEETTEEHANCGRYGPSAPARRLIDFIQIRRIVGNYWN